MKGIDISNYQAGLNLSSLKSNGYSFAMLKATEGQTISDRSFSAHYNSAKSAGIPLGCYCYSHATSVEGSRAEAAFLLHVIEGKDFPLGVYMDVETDAQMALSNTQLQEVIEAFCQIIRAAGYTPGLYGSEYRTWAKVNDNLPSDIIRWVAHYGKTPAISCDLWQSSDSGKVAGYNGPVDTDVTMSQRMVDLINGKQSNTVPVSETVNKTFPPDPSVAIFQMVMCYNGYDTPITGYKTKEFFAKLREFVDDMEIC